MKKKRKIKIILLIISSILLIGLIGLTIYLCIYSEAVDVDEYLTSDEYVTITDKGNYYIFDGSGSDDALIFYPGAKVDTKAYAPIMHMIAKEGIDCFLVDMPFHLAIFGSNKANDVIKDFGDYKTYYIGGHSLGGAMASNYAKEHTDIIKGLLLLAAYPDESISDTDLVVMSLYGSNDGVLNMDKYNEAKDNKMPSNFSEHVIEGGNHSGFGSYGDQDGDNEATISKELQWTYTATYMLELKLKVAANSI